MSEPIGGFCLVLHAHMPYVLRNGGAPHGAPWLYEAMAETYLPLLDLIGDIALHGIRPAITVGLTPILLEQLADEDLKAGFVEYTHGRISRARDDRTEFLRHGDGKLAELAAFWEKFHVQSLERFEQIGRDIPRQFALRRDEGHLEILTGAATHAYLPLLLNDQSIAAQLAAGTATTRRILGGPPARGIWLPECAYRPASESWLPPVLEKSMRRCAGIESFLPPIGADHTFLDAHHLAGGTPLGVIADGRFFAASSSQAHHDHRSGWREPMEPVGISSYAGRAEAFAFARHPKLSDLVWSSHVGYPGDGNYLEFHKKHHPGNFRYWRVTDVAADLGAKEPYDPSVVAGRVYDNAQHFCSVVREVLSDYHKRTGRRGVVTAAFDAELFGHWWFEGPRFLRDVILTLNADPTITRLTSLEALTFSPPDKVMRPHEGSWGKSGDHSVWLNDQTHWMWEVEHRAERDMNYAMRHLPWRQHARVSGVLKSAARELLLLQSSDWPFMVENKSALDYGIKRFSVHATRFDRAISIAHRLAAGNAQTALPPLPATELAEMDAHDPVFSEIDLEWWA